ncbi:MAG: hypothetical protein ACRCZR_05695 [Cetobacterium sp.]|uniref:hypothetical protein n=1 Tax=Cetobacterium sp. TaxID=2071632 RepID=UPI003F36A815
MKMIRLEKGESFYIENKCYVILEGRGIVKYILPDGKVIVNECILEKNNIAYNLLNLNLDLINKTLLFKEAEGLFKAFEETLVQEVEINYDLKKKLYNQLIESYILKEMNLMMTSVEYVLFTLKKYSKNKYVCKEVISYDDFNLSRSQFYLVLQKLKKNRYLIERENGYILVKNPK